MSTFRVKLVQGDQSNLDEFAEVNGGVSLQRQMWATGPNLTFRLLSDGEEFDDCNYWKRYAYPQVPRNEAFIEVVTDDGSPFSDIASENVFIRTYSFTVAQNSAFSANVIDILGDNGNPAIALQIEVVSNNVSMRINGSSTAVTDIAAGATLSFDAGEISANTLEFSEENDGAATVEVIATIRSKCNS